MGTKISITFFFVCLESYKIPMGRFPGELGSMAIARPGALYFSHPRAFADRADQPDRAPQHGRRELALGVKVIPTPPCVFY